MQNQDVGEGRQRRHRREILQRIVVEFFIHADIDRHRRHVGHQQGITIGRGTRDDFRAETATGTGAVVNNHRLAEARRQALRHFADDDVAATAGGEGHDITDGARRIVLCAAGHRQHRTRDADQGS